MNFIIKKTGLLFAFFAISFLYSHAQEKVFAGYFDIAVGSPKNEEVIGRIHLERNKDVLTNPIPKTYKFSIVKQQGNLFSLQTRFDATGRIMGVLTVNKNLDEKSLGDYHLQIALKDGAKQLNSFPITVKVVKQTLWQTLYERYKDITISNAGYGRMFGRKKTKDPEVEKLITELGKTNGEFSRFGFYHTNAKDYKPVGKSIEYDWEVVANTIGGLGYAYATSKKYGPNGDAESRKQLKNTLYNALIAYTEAIPVEGKDVIIDGKPIGDCTGDGFANLKLHNLIEEQVVTHQWVFSDGLIAPVVHLMPEMMAEMQKGDKKAQRVYDGLVRLYQTAMAEVANRRDVNDPKERWGEITDTLRSSGAWADANLGHRSRMMLALPIIWADYNRPMTYVQYWYSDYYKDQPFKGFSFSPGWSPHGVVFDVARWMTKYDVPTHYYIQSGFQPDGTISHHIANATDAAMVAYGFEWLTDCLTGFNQFKNTDFKLASKYYQFPADRIEKVYPKMIYNGRFDFLVSGRSFADDLKKFVSHEYLKAIKDLEAVSSVDTKLTNQKALDEIYYAISNNTHQYSGTDAYWVNEYLVHRRGQNEKPYYASLKLKSKRTVGAEDFGKVRRSWYAGYGILPLKISGDEYSEKVLANYDWHALPGLTEEWRTDAMPTGHAQASLPGENLISNVTSDGKNGMAIYHHLPGETYSGATAYKTYHFIDNKIIALGNNIKRIRSGQQQNIVTILDQSAFDSKITISQNGRTEGIEPNQSVNATYTIQSPTWLHIGAKGYIIFPEGEQKLIIKTGSEINKTDKNVGDSNPNFIIAIDHGKDPKGAGYRYFLVPNITAAEMPAVVDNYGKEVEIKKEADAHAVYAKNEKVWQADFFKPTAITVGDIKIQAEEPAQFMLADNGDNWTVIMANPVPSLDKEQMVFHISMALKPGKYAYQLPGIYPCDGEFVTITKEGNGSKLVVELPDKRDEAFYDYRAELYNAAPIVIRVEK